MGCPLQLYLLRMFCFLSPYAKFQNLVFPNAFNKVLIKCGKIVSCLMQYSKKIWEMTKNLGADPAELLNTTISKFCHSSYMVIKNIAIPAIVSLPSFKTLLTCHIELFGLVIWLNFFEICRNYVSIIITIISKITVLVSHNVICFGYFILEL